MEWLDISTYLSLNAAPTIAVLIITLIISVAIYFDCKACEEDPRQPLFALFICGSIIMTASLFFLLPTHGKLLEVKIERIKNGAVNKDNINKSVEALERITKKLECKYLGGKECNKGE